MVDITCIADLHGHYPKLEGGDLLIVAGDLTRTDGPDEHVDFAMWINKQNYKKKIVISGNHDNSHIKYGGDLFNQNTMEYLCDSGTEFQYEQNEIIYNSDNSVILDVAVKKMKKLKIWGSPWTKTFKGMNPHCKAFTVDTEEELVKKWSLIPQGIDILVTHSPSYGVLDEVSDGENVGSETLIKPMIKSGCRLHVFGHIHEAYGKFYNPMLGITYVNASHVNEKYQPVNKPIRVIL